MKNMKKLYEDKVKLELKNELNIANIMEVPKITKICVNQGINPSKVSKGLEASLDVMLLFTGQKPIVTKAKKSISNFKTREGQKLGCKVTLRGQRMYDFLSKLINVALPKIRDFKGVSRKSFDKSGNYSLGFRESTIFPEIAIEKADYNLGFDVTIVTTAKKWEDSFTLLEKMGMPFRKN